MDEFEEQLRLEQEARERESRGETATAATYTDADGTVYEWDAARRGWFPKIDEDFLAMYQLNYGTYDNTSATDTSTVQKASIETAPSASTEQIASKTTGASHVVALQANASASEFVGKNKKRKQPRGAATLEGEQPGAEKHSRTEQTDDAHGAGTNKTEGWFELPAEKNANVYVTGLPEDITEAEFVELMSKCGMVKYDTLTKRPKVKLYRDADSGRLKGDALCSYIKPESVDLAMQILDGYSVRDATIHVERARFERKSSANVPGTSNSRRRKLTAREKRREAERQSALFKWTFESNRFVRARHERVVIVSNAFDPAQFSADPLALDAFRVAVRDACARFGELLKVVVYDRNQEGVLALTYEDPAQADIAIAQLDGRVVSFASGRVVQAATWDGRTRYAVTETEEDFNERRDRWSSFLKEDEQAGSAQAEVQAEAEALPIATSSDASDPQKQEETADADNEAPKENLFSLYAEVGIADGGATPTHVEDVDTDGEEQRYASGESDSDDDNEYKHANSKKKSLHAPGRPSGDDSSDSSFDSNDERNFDEESDNDDADAGKQTRLPDSS